MIIAYPVERLLAQPKLFNAIANYLGGPDAETIRSSFYDLIEFNFEGTEPDDCEFEAQEARFESHDEGALIVIYLDNGVACELRATDNGLLAQINNEGELAAASAVYRKLVSVIEESYPELKGDIALCSPPTPSNNFLSSDNGDFFEGTFHLKSDPEKTYSFNIKIIDQDLDEMKASIKQM